MRTILRHSALLLALSACTVLPALAQTADAPPASTQTEGHRHHSMDPAKMTKHLTKKLGLSADQASQVEPILADRQTKMQSLASDTTLDQNARRDRMRAIQADSEQRIDAVLTDTQKQQFAAMRAEHRHGHKGGENNAPGQAPSA